MGPQPQCYRASVTSLSDAPTLSYVDGSSAFQQVFNPAWVPPSRRQSNSSTAADVRAGLLIRAQNCTAVPGGPCVRCAGTGPNASVIAFSRLLSDDSSTSSPPRFAPVSAADVVFGPSGDMDARGTEDPRLAYDARDGVSHNHPASYARASAHPCFLSPVIPPPAQTYHLLYTCSCLGILPDVHMLVGIRRRAPLPRNLTRPNTRRPLDAPRAGKAPRVNPATCHTVTPLTRHAFPIVGFRRAAQERGDACPGDGPTLYVPWRGRNQALAIA